MVEATAPRPAADERRQITVLFADLVGSTALSSRLDPEDLGACLKRYHEAAAAVVARQDGHVAQYLGDGMLAYFGWPRAHDDSAVRAVRAAMGVIEAVAGLGEELERTLGVRLQVRVGLHSGPVVLSEVGAGQRLALGETPNLAARVQSLAEPGTVVISEATARLVKGWFRLRSLGEQTLRGIPRPVEVLRVEGASGARSRLEARPTLSPLLGRDAERAALRAAWEAVRGGGRRGVLLVGESGVGKSRLAFDAATSLQAEARVVVVSGVDGREGVPLHPLVERLRLDLGLAEGDTGPAAFAAVEAAAAGWSGAPPEAVPLAAALLGFAPGALYAPAQGAPATLRALSFATLTAALAPGPDPLLLLLDDVQWVDPSTQEWVRGLLADATSPPRLVLMTSRPTPDPAAWAGLPETTRIDLPGLDAGAAEAVVRGVAGGRSLPSPLVEELRLRSGGVPLFLEEMTLAVLASDRVRVYADRVELLDGGIGAIVPPTIQDTLVARLDALGPARRLAQLAAAFGLEFRADHLATTASLAGAEVDAGLGTLRAAGFVAVDPGTPDGYRFRHALLRDTAYNTLSRADRQAQHGRILGALRAGAPDLDERQPALVAGHLFGAGRLGEAIERWQAAGQKAALASAFLESATTYRRALAELPALPDPAARDRLELGLRLGLGLALVSTQGFATPEVEATYRRAAELSTRAESLPFPLLYGIFSVSAVRGDLQALSQVWDRTVALAASAPDPIQEFWAHSALCMVHIFAGRFEDARREGDAAVALLRAHDPGQFLQGLIAYSSEALLYGHYYCAWAHNELGDTEAATALWREAGTLAEGTAHPYMKAVAQGFESALLLNAGDAVGSREKAEQVITASAAGGYPWWLYVGKAIHGGAVGRLGDATAAAAELREAIYVIRLMGGFVVVPNYCSYLADALGLAGDHAGALAAAEEGLACDGASLAGVPTHARLRAQVALYRLRLGTGTEAEAREALAAAPAAGAKLYWLAGAADLARWLREQGRRAEADTLLDEVLAATGSAATSKLRRDVEALRAAAPTT